MTRKMLVLLRVSLVLLLLSAVLAGARGTIVQADPLLTLSLNQTTFRPRDTLRVGLQAGNPGPGFNADFYFGVLLPDGVTVVFITSLSPLNGMATRVDADPRTFKPITTNVLIPQGLNVALNDVFVFTFSGNEPPGTYVFFAFLTPPSAFTDGRVDAGDVLVIDTKAFSVLKVLGIFSETAPETLEFDVNAFIGIFTGGGGTFGEFVEDAVDKQEGAVSLRATVLVNAAQGEFAGWFASWGNAAQVANNAFVRDMSQFAGGRLLFWVRSPVDLEVRIRSGNVAAGSETSKVLVSQFEPAVVDNAWHRVCIPLAVLAGPPPKADLSRIKVFFVVASNTPSGGTRGMPATFRIDDVRWESAACR